MICCWFCVDLFLFLAIIHSSQKFPVTLLDAGRPTITIDQSSLHQIPNHLEKLLKSMAARKLTAQIDLINGLVVAVGLECGFVGDWSFCGDDVKTFALSWSYSLCRQLLDFASYPPEPEDDGPRTFKFVFSLDPQCSITVHSLESGDSLILTAILNGEASTMTSVKTVAFPISRFVINKKLNSKNLPANFRNLDQLSILLKDKIFLPLRNEIYRSSSCESPYPSLDGCPADVTLKILSYLKPKDIASLSAVCKIINETTVPYLLRNKSKKD